MLPRRASGRFGHRVFQDRARLIGFLLPRLEVRLRQASVLYGCIAQMVIRRPARLRDKCAPAYAREYR